MLYKLGALVNNENTEHLYENRFAVQQGTGYDRLCIGAAHRHIDVLLALAEQLEPPFYILYVLHTPRRSHQAARYESPVLELVTVDAFFKQFRLFLEQDARHDIWLHAAGNDATLIWERHSLIYAYGPLPQFETILKQCGCVQGSVTVPVPHRHFYHAAFDADEDEILSFFDWNVSPLEPEDEQ